LGACRVKWEGSSCQFRFDEQRLHGRCDRTSFFDGDKRVEGTPRGERQEGGLSILQGVRAGKTTSSFPLGRSMWGVRCAVFSNPLPARLAVCPCRALVLRPDRSVGTIRAMLCCTGDSALMPCSVALTSTHADKPTNYSQLWWCRLTNSHGIGH
jgi:hypothetical protein